jgi:hypothetical protein
VEQNRKVLQNRRISNRIIGRFLGGTKPKGFVCSE